VKLKRKKKKEEEEKRCAAGIKDGGSRERGGGNLLPKPKPHTYVLYGNRTTTPNPGRAAGKNAAAAGCHLEEKCDVQPRRCAPGARTYRTRAALWRIGGLGKQRQAEDFERLEIPATCGTTQGSTSGRCGTKERRTV